MILATVAVALVKGGTSMTNFRNEIAQSFKDLPRLSQGPLPTAASWIDPTMDDGVDSGKFTSFTRLAQR